MWLSGLSREEFQRFIPSAAAGFLLLASYECLRSPSNVLFQTVFGTENLPAVMTALPLVLIVFIAFYNLCLTRLGPRRTLQFLTALSIVGLYVLAWGGMKQIPWMVALLFLWGQSYVVVLGEQYWSYFDSAFTPETGKKTHGILAGIMSLGSFSGGLTVHFLSSKIGATALPFLGATLLIPGLWLFSLAYRRAPEIDRVPEHSKSSDSGTLELFKTTPLLTYLALAVLATQMLSTTLGLTFQTLLHEAMPSLDAQTAYSGKFYATVGFLSLIFQFLITPVILQWVRPELIQALLPVVQLGSCLYLFLHPTVAAAAVAFALFKSLDYSLFRASKEVLYMPLSFDARYRAKEWIDVFGYRIGKGMASGLVWAGQRLLLSGVTLYGGLSLLAVLSWLSLNRKILARGPVYNDLPESRTIPH